MASTEVRRFKKCKVPGCNNEFNARLRSNVCAPHKHHEICNCRRCEIKRKLAAAEAAKAKPHDPNRPITLHPAPWA